MLLFSTEISSKTVYPFGSVMNTRNWAASSYRYGFNGKEDDAETQTQNYGMRIYNPSLGKFLSVDPLTNDYPWYTPYQFAGNMPINAIDMDGAEPLEMINENGKLTAPVIAFLSTAFDWDSKRMETVTVTRKYSMYLGSYKVLTPNYYMKTTGTKRMNSNAEIDRSYTSWLSSIGHEMVHLNLLNDAPLEMLNNFSSLDFIYKDHDEQNNEIEAESIEAKIKNFCKKEDIEGILTSEKLSETDKVNCMTMIGYMLKVKLAENKLSDLESELVAKTATYDKLKTTASPDAASNYYNQNIQPVQNAINATKVEISEVKKEAGDFADTLE